MFSRSSLPEVRPPLPSTSSPAGGKAVILTDWDRRGGNLAAALRDILGRDNPDIDGSVREDLSRLSRHYIKDVEALDSLVDRLSADPRLL